MLFLLTETASTLQVPFISYFVRLGNPLCAFADSRAKTSCCQGCVREKPSLNAFMVLSLPVFKA